MTLRIYNTLTRQKETFKPIVPGSIDMYVCGITVYDFCHIGHARVLVAFDVIARYLRSQGWNLNYVRNITDVDDKILKRANENAEPYSVLTERMITAMHQDESVLGVLRPDLEPRATEYIDEIIAMIEVLIDKGHAYALENGDVYYQINSFSEYGKLSKRSPEDLLTTARIDANLNKKDQRDFALWKSAGVGEVSWQSPWGPGRPGWHIECSAMSTCCLGATFDIHGGGPDLPFPHHENEIAQSEAATGQKYVNYWMHAGAVRVDNEKMSKSLGNFFTIKEVLKKYHPEIVRYFLLSSHYRSPINYSEENLIEAKTGLERFYMTLRQFSDIQPTLLSDLKGSKYYDYFIAAMNDDFNTREAIAVMYDMIRQINTMIATNKQEAFKLVAELKALGGIFDILGSDPEDFMKGGVAGSQSDSLAPSEIDALVLKRAAAKKNQDFLLADQIRSDLLAQGVVLEDSREATSWRRE